MDLLPTEEQQQIVDSAAHFLRNEFPLQQRSAAAQASVQLSPQQLQKIAALGWLGIGLGTADFGIGYGLAEETLVFVELGRQLLPPSLLGSVLAARMLAASKEHTRLQDILDGTTKVATGIARTTTAHHIGSVISGEFLVFEAQSAELVLLVDENTAALVPLSALQSETETACIDDALQVSCARADDARALCAVAATTEPIFLRGAVLTSALLLGIAEATLQRSVDYAKERQQFNKPIGSFQAIKHYCADMAIRCESVRALLYHASITLSEQGAAGTFDAAALKALAAQAAQQNANTAVQIHGGMGYTQEMDIHLFVKRAQLLSMLFGDTRHHLEKVLHQTAPT